MGWVGEPASSLRSDCRKGGVPTPWHSVAASYQRQQEPVSRPAAHAMAEKLSKEQVADFKAVFTRFDTDGDGSINLQELGDAMRALGQDPTEAELKDIIARVDTDGDGAISFQEFLAEMAKRMKSGISERDMQEVFRAFDLDGDGHISVDELKQAMAQVGEKLSQEDVEAMIREADLDQDGQVNYEEFTRILTR